MWNVIVFEYIMRRININYLDVICRVRQVVSEMARSQSRNRNNNGRRNNQGNQQRGPNRQRNQQSKRGGKQQARGRPQKKSGLCYIFLYQ